MKNRNIFTKLFVAVLNAALLISLSVPAGFAQSNLPAPRQETLLNGLKVLMWVDPGAKDVNMKIRIHSGAAFDPQGKEGVMKVLAESIFPTSAAREFFTEDLGGSLEIVTTYDYIQINASSKPEGFLTMLETLSAAVSNPAIDKETTAKVRDAILPRVKAMESDPAYIADRAVAKRLFGTFPYGRPEFGTTESLQKIDFADLLDAKKRFLTADNATVTISGNFDNKLGFRAVRRYFGGWLKSDKRVPSTFKQPDDPIVSLQIIATPKADVSAIRFAVIGVARNNKDFVAASLFSFILEDRLRSRVPAANVGDIFVRSEEHILPGIFVIGFLANREASSDDKIKANNEVTKTISAPITDAEFAAAKSRFAYKWSKRDAATFWLDVDTFRTVSAEADNRIADNITIADVRSFAEKIQKSPMVSVLVNTPPPTN